MDSAKATSLDSESYISLETFRRSGAGVKTPVWFAETGGRLYVFSEATAGKMKRLRNSDAARVAACSVRGAVHGEWLDAKARRVDDPDSVQRAYAALHAKYGWQMKLTDLFSRLTGRIDGRAIVEIELQ